LESKALALEISKLPPNFGIQSFSFGNGKIGRFGVQSFSFGNGKIGRFGVQSFSFGNQ